MKNPSTAADSDLDIEFATIREYDIFAGEEAIDNGARTATVK
jgi:hypothetical protein